MNTPFKKRSNPLAQTVTPSTATQPVSQPVEQAAPQPTYVQQPEVKPVVQPVYSAPVQPTYRQAKPVQVVNPDLSRVKYTATMDKDIRRRVKIACVNQGLQFSQYIEAAVLEKMRKEGF